MGAVHHMAVDPWHFGERAFHLNTDLIIHYISGGARAPNSVAAKAECCDLTRVNRPIRSLRSTGCGCRSRVTILPPWPDPLRGSGDGVGLGRRRRPWGDNYGELFARCQSKPTFHTHLALEGGLTHDPGQCLMGSCCGTWQKILP